MRKQLQHSKKIFQNYVELDYTNLQILNELNIEHGYPMRENYSYEIRSLEPSNDFTQFLIFTELVYGKGRVPKIPIENRNV